MITKELVRKKMAGGQDRREFLKFMGALGIGLAPLLAAPAVREMIFCPSLPASSKTRPLMGTYVTVTVVDQSTNRAVEAVEAAFGEMERLIPLFDRHCSHTPLAHLNRVGRLKDVAPEMTEVLNLAEGFHRHTDGFFDITIGPLLDLMERHFSLNSGPPSQMAVAEALGRIGTSYLRHSRQEVRLLKEGMEITLDGIAKGYIVDKAIALLRSRGIKHALINAGGDIRALGEKSPGRPWKIAIQDPLDKKKVVGIIPLRDMALATSGNYENFFDPDRRFHHIINPETGLSPQTFASVTVLADSLVVADALATAAFIPPYVKARDILRAVPRCEGLWIDRNRTLVRTEGMKMG